MDSNGKHRKDARTPHETQLEASEMTKAHLAWEAWKSNDPAAWDFALAERERIIRKNPKAWKKAMHQIDEDEADQRDNLVVTTPSRDVEPPRPAAAPVTAEMDEANIVPVPQPQSFSVPPDAVPIDDPPVHPGYAPYSQFAPPVPQGPAFRSAYENRPEFYGLDLGILRVGANSNGSLEFGVDVGVASTNVQVGLENQVRAEFMPHGGPLHARGNAGIGLNRNGLHSEVGAGGNFLNLVHGDADFGAHVGRYTGVAGDVRGRVWPVDVQAASGAGIGSEGINVYTGANTGLDHVFGVRSGAQFDLGRNSGTAVGVGLNAGDTAIDFGPSITSYGGRAIQPRLNFYSQPASYPAFYPTGRRYF